MRKYFFGFQASFLAVLGAFSLLASQDLSRSLGSYALEHNPLPEYQSRRDSFMRMVGDGIIVLWGNRDDRSYGDVGPFRQDNTFMYFTGVELPNAVLLLLPQSHDEYLFIPGRNPSLERWTGPKLAPGPEARSILGIQNVRSVEGGTTEIDARIRPVESFEQMLERLLPERKTLYAVLRTVGVSSDLSAEMRYINKLRERLPDFELRDVSPFVASLRRRKSKDELRLLQRSIDITMEAHRSAAKLIADGRAEYEIDAIVGYTFRKNGSEGPSFPSIIGSGFNSTVLHYDQNVRMMQNGDVVVIDIGALYGFYSADITRTYPVGGKFSKRQQEIYSVVLGAQEAAIKECRPGVTMGQLRKIAYDYINSHGKDKNGQPLGKYFIHGLGHFLGMDVHDVGDVGSSLQEGDVITIEPGIYLPDEELGVRIEDDFLISKNGCEHLSKNLPRTIEEIESMMKR